MGRVEGVISYVADFSGDPGSCHLSRERVGCPARAACTKKNAHSAEQTASRAWFYIIHAHSLGLYYQHYYYEKGASFFITRKERDSHEEYTITHGEQIYADMPGLTSLTVFPTTTSKPKEI